MALAHQRIAPLAPQMDVEHDDVDLVVIQNRAGSGERVRFEHFVALELEVDPAQQPDRRLVVDDEHPKARRMAPGIPH
jgi:hypothetical protein